MLKIANLMKTAKFGKVERIKELYVSERVITSESDPSK